MEPELLELVEELRIFRERNSGRRYTPAIRKKVVDLVSKGIGRREISAECRICIDSINRWSRGSSPQKRGYRTRQNSSLFREAKVIFPTTYEICLDLNQRSLNLSKLSTEQVLEIFRGLLHAP